MEAQTQKDSTDEIKKCQAEAQEYLDKWKRAEANLVNYQKDELKRIQEMLKFGNEGVILEMIEIMDHIERAIDYAPPPIKEEKNWYLGLWGIEKEFLERFKKLGVERIETQGKKFNPTFMEAVSGEDEVVYEEARAGYTLHGKVIRPARVILGSKNN